MTTVWMRLQVLKVFVLALLAVKKLIMDKPRVPVLLWGNLIWWVTGPYDFVCVYGAAGGGDIDMDSSYILPSQKSLLSTSLKQRLIEKCSPNSTVN